MKSFICTGVLALASNSVAQDLTPVSSAQTRAIILSGATVHTVSGASIERGVVMFAKGTLAWVATSEEARELESRVRWASPGPERIDVSGRHIYPGLIGAYTVMGLEEMTSIRATRDTQETGEFTPEARAFIAVNPDSTLLPVARTNGVLLCGVFPQAGGGGLLPGQPSVIRLHGWTTEDLAVATSIGQVVHWPFMRTVAGLDDKREDEQAREIARRVASLAEFFAQARAYSQSLRDGPKYPVDLRLDAMRVVLDSAQVDVVAKDSAGERSADGRSRPRPVFVHAIDVDQITSAVTFCAERSLRCVIVGGRDAPLCADLLKKHDVAVVILGTHQLPRRADSDHDAPYRLPAVLKEKGVRFCIASGQDTGHERNLPYAAATAVAFGLPMDDAIRAITLWAAQILGVDDRYGSIEVGKSATMIITPASPLEITTNVEMAFIDGRKVGLSNKQTDLAKRFEERYKQLAPVPAQNDAPRP